MLVLERTVDGAAVRPEVLGKQSTAAAPEVLALPSTTELPAWVTAHGAAFRGEHDVRGRRFAYALWDSRRLQLSLVPGDVDPGGTGRIDAATWGALVAAFNGGFRGVHGSYGLRAEGRTFLPPRAGLATLARFEGGWVLGTLPVGAAVDAAEMVRQNLPPLFAEGVFDPTHREIFGGLAPGKTGGRTTRSALGLRADGFFVYAYGIDVTAEELSLAATDAGAGYVMALDINDGQAGFEWLAVGAAANGPARATVHDAARASWDGVAHGRRVHAERLSVPMGTPLPRWLNGDSRDYFVLWKPEGALPAARLAAGPADWAPAPGKEK